MYELQKFDDEIDANASVAAGRLGQHNLLYLVEGSATVDGAGLEAGMGVCAGDCASVRAGSAGARIWRWSLNRTGAPSGSQEGAGTRSTLRMSRRIKMFELVPTSRWLFRLDQITGFRGSTGLHSHPGSGIRCMVEGQMRTESEKGENTNNTRPGDVWYEEGAYPLTSTVDTDRTATFLRGMVLPPEFLTAKDTINSITEFTGSSEGWKCCAQSVVTLR
jgi:hypothetical protein